MVSLDLLSCHVVFDAVSHSVGIAIASVTLLHQCSLSLVSSAFISNTMDRGGQFFLKIID